LEVLILAEAGEYKFGKVPHAVLSVPGRLPQFAPLKTSTVAVQVAPVELSQVQAVHVRPSLTVSYTVCCVYSPAGQEVSSIL